MAEQQYILALDIGTSSTRAILYDTRGTVVDDVHSQLTYKLTTSHEGEASVDAEALFKLVTQSIDEALGKAGDRAGKIVGVATSAFWHTLVPLDKTGKPLMALMTWEDTRPQEAVKKLRTQLDEATIHQRTGVRLHTSYWPAKISWLLSTHPEIVERTARFVSFGEYMHERLLGRAICSLSMASGTGLLNTRERNWDREMLEFLHLTPDHLSSLGDLSDMVQDLRPEFASRWPALAHVPWLPAVGDGAAANIGSNCVTSSIWAITMGTSSAIRVVVPPEQVTPAQGLWLYYVDKNRALLGGALSEGGNMRAWLSQTLHLPPLDEMDEQLEQMEPTTHGLTILPMLSGERAPGWHTDVHMTIAGLTLHSTPVEIALAALEAVVFQLSVVYDQLQQALASQVKQPRLIVSGAALLKSRVLRQALADTLDRPLELSESSEASARGVALLALETLGHLSNLTDLTPEESGVVQPDASRHTAYMQARSRQQALYDLLLD